MHVLPPHSVLSEPDFRSTWFAQDQARLLEAALHQQLFEVDFDYDSNIWIKRSIMDIIAVESSLHVHTGILERSEDSSDDIAAGFQSEPVVVPNSYQPILHRPDQEEVPNFHDPPVHSDDSDRQHGGPPRRPLRHFPAWVESIWNILQIEGAAELLEEGPIIYLSTYYISHETCLQQRADRPIRFTRDYDQWEEVIKEVWEDHFDRLSSI